jgi:hypothetical protein
MVVSPAAALANCAQVTPPAAATTETTAPARTLDRLDLLIPVTPVSAGLMRGARGS